MDEASAETRERRPLRLSVRALMVLILIVGATLGWALSRVRVQRDAVAIIKRAGGRVAYDWQWQPPNGPSVWPPPKPPGPDWLRKRLGPDFLDTVVYVHLKNQPCDDEVMRTACRLTGLKELSVIGTQVTDAGAEGLANLKNLQFLDLRLNKTTSKPLRHIAAMSDLRELMLHSVLLRDEEMVFLRPLTRLERLTFSSSRPPNCRLSDAWLVNIASAVNVRILELYDMPITSEGLRHLSRLTNLRVLTLHGTEVSSFEALRPLAKLRSVCVAYTPVADRALLELQSFPELYYLDLRKTSVTDAGMRALSELPSLRDLNLGQTNITDAGLRFLAGSKTLRSLNLRGTQVTDAGLAEFTKTNPQVKVSR